MAVLNSFDCYLRAGDVDNMRTNRVHFLGMEERRPYYAALTLPITKRGRHQSVMVRPRYMAVLLRREVESRRVVLGGEEKLFNIRPAGWRKEIKRAAVRAGLSGLEITPLALRYGGATTDKMERRLRDKNIQDRGRWSSDKTMQEYIRPDDLLREWPRYPTEHERKQGGYWND